MNSELIKAIAVLIIAAAIAVVLKNYRPEFAFTFVLGASAVAAIIAFGAVSPVLGDFYSVIEGAQIPSSIFSVPIKALGIAYLTTFAADTCRDFGQGALASKAELVGRFAVFFLTVPLLKSILETAVNLAKK